MIVDTIMVDITTEINEPSVLEQPMCNCWYYRNDPNIGMWEEISDFNKAVFDNAPKVLTREAKMCICYVNQRLAHISMAGGMIGIDVPLLEDIIDDNDGQQKTVFAQSTYCAKCNRFEKRRYTTYRIDSPIIWCCCTSKAVSK